MKLWLRRITYLLAGWSGFLALLFAVLGDWPIVVFLLIGLGTYLGAYGLWCKYGGC